MKPEKVNILGIEYSIAYVDKPSEVDIYKRESLWGQIDYWTRTIRIYDNERPVADVFQAVLHEVLHGIAEALKLELNKPERHDELDLIALALADVFFRNGWLPSGLPTLRAVDKSGAGTTPAPLPSN
jgi:hypothetical protein